MKNLFQSENRMPARLAWDRPKALWILPLIFLFLATSLPLLAPKGLSSSALILPATALMSLLMAFVLVHHFFSFVHHLDKNDFYFALPSSRSKLFWKLNASALTYLIVPSLIIMGLNSVLILFLGRSPMEAWASYGPSLPQLWTSYAGQVLQLVYFFLLLELAYLVTEKAGSAVTAFVLINVFWPLLLYLYSDATSRFLPGLLNPLTGEGQGGPGFFALFSLLSPGFFMLQDGLNPWTFPMLAGLALLTYLAFRRRQAGYSPASSSIHWPFELTQWMGIMSLTLLGGFGAHSLRISTADFYPSADLAPLLSPLPFLVGSGLGFLMALWAFNLIRGKGRLDWRALPWTILVTAIPYLAWLALTMTGTGFSSELPKAQELSRIRIHYRESYDLPYPNRSEGSFSFDLTDPRDLALFAGLYEEALNPDNPGLALPRTLSSKELFNSYVREIVNRPVGEGEESGGDPFYYGGWFPESHFSLWTKEGRRYQRIMALPQTWKNDSYLQLLRGNRRFFLAELSQYSIQGKVRVSYKLQATDRATDQDRETWIDPLLEMQADKTLFFSDSDLGYMAGWIARKLALESDAYFDQLQADSPALIQIKVDLFGIQGTEAGDLQILLPVDPDKMPGLKILIDQQLNFYRELQDREAYKGTPGLG